MSREAMSCLKGKPFPGNIRELRNLIERALLLADENQLMPKHLPSECRDSGRNVAQTPFP